LAYDLNSADLVSRYGLVLDDHALVILRTEGMAGRTWRVPYAQVESLSVRQQLPIWRILIVACLLLLPAGLLLLLQDPIAYAFSGALGTIGLALVGFYIWARRTTLTFTYGPQTKSYPVITRPARLTRFITRFDQHVRTAQSTAADPKSPADANPESPTTSTEN
jgi:hypothetical protein